MNELDLIIKEIKQKNKNNPIFKQAFEEVAHSIKIYLSSLSEGEADKYIKILPSLFEPDRIISFKVLWNDDKGKKRVNRGWRIQYNGALGPYKGGLRFDESVSEDILKFLSFEQIFKNSLTGLFLGGGKGGCDINPKELSDSELENFSLAFMAELKKYIGASVDVPAGDIGVGAKQIGRLYGAYRKLGGSFEGVLTGKGLDYGGLNGRSQATGFGVVYILKNMLDDLNQDIKNMTVLISGSGNVSLHAGIKAIDFGAKVISFSDRKGLLYKEEGFSKDDIMKIKELKSNRKSLQNSNIDGSEFKTDQNPSILNGDIFLPCATQNEVNINDLKRLERNGVKFIVEGANMPLDGESVEYVSNSEIYYIPGKASNAGGVAMSGIEMNQNSGFSAYDFESVDQKLQEIMKNIYNQISVYGKTENGLDFVYGANIAGFVRVAKSMTEQGL